MRPWQFSVGAKVERAKEHIAEFDKTKSAFLTAHQYKTVSHFNPKTSELTFTIDGNHRIPARLATITSDAVHNMRSALDICWHQAVTQGIRSARKEYFPIVRRA